MARGVEEGEFFASFGFHAETTDSLCDAPVFGGGDVARAQLVE